jgi:hypothetical protein
MTGMSSSPASPIKNLREIGSRPKKQKHAPMKNESHVKKIKFIVYLLCLSSSAGEINFQIWYKIKGEDATRPVKSAIFIYTSATSCGLKNASFSIAPLAGSRRNESICFVKTALNKVDAKKGTRHCINLLLNSSRCSIKLKRLSCIIS